MSAELLGIRAKLLVGFVAIALFTGALGSYAVAGMEHLGQANTLTGAAALMDALDDAHERALTVLGRTNPRVGP